MVPDYRRSLKRHYSRLGLALFLYMLATVAAEYAMQLLVASFWPEFLDSGWYLVTLSFVPMYLIGFPVFLWALPPAAPKELRPPKQKLPGKLFFPLLLMCFGFLYPGNLIGQGLNEALSFLSCLLNSGSSGSGGNALEMLASGSDLLPYSIVAVILGPLMEEITFRKLLLDRMRTIDKPAAVFFSALAFGLFHGNVVQFFYAFGVGLLFGVIYIRTGKLWYSVALYMLVNFFGSVVTMLLLPQIDMLHPLDALAPLLALGGYAMLLLTAAVAGVVLLIKHRKKLYVGDEYDRLRGMRFSTAFCTVGFTLYLLASIAVCAMAYI